MPAKKKAVDTIDKKAVTKATIPSIEAAPKPTIEENAAPKKPLLQNARKRDTSLSLKSIKQPKEVEKTHTEESYEDYPRTVFTAKQLGLFWKEYVALLQKKGEQSMAAIMGLIQPVLGDHFQITCEVSNTLMQDQFLKGRPKLVHFLREKLNNYGIDIQVELNEAISKKFAYTPQEKFNKLKEKNPMIDKLRQTFELDL